MLRGLSALSVDSKGRIAIPARHRDKLKEMSSARLVVTVDAERCLLIYPLNEWHEVEKRLVALPSTDRRARGLKRLLLGYAEECEMDGQGRILLSAPLRGFAELDKRVVLVGQGNKFELWDELRWQSLQEELVALGAEQSLPGSLEVSF